jgi:hypothetical protein
MAIQAQGTVTGVSTKQITSMKSGAPKNFTIHLATVDGLDAVLNTGFKQVYNPGDQFSGLVEKNYGEYKEVKGQANGAAAAPSSYSATTFSTPKQSEGRETFPLDPLHSKNLILRQNAINAASTALAGTISKTTSDTDVANSIINVASVLVKWTTGRAEQEALDAMELGEKVE